MLKLNHHNQSFLNVCKNVPMWNLWNLFTDANPPCCVQGFSMEQACGSFPNSSTCLQRRGLLRPPTATWNMSGMTLKQSLFLNIHIFTVALLFILSGAWLWAVLGFSPGNDVFSSLTHRHFHCLVYLIFFFIPHMVATLTPCSHPAVLKGFYKHSARAMSCSTVHRWSSLSLW